MQLIEKIKENKILKAIIIILSIPIMVKALYYINLIGVYFGTFLRKFFIWIG